MVSAGFCVSAAVGRALPGGGRDEQGDLGRISKEGTTEQTLSQDRRRIMIIGSSRRPPACPGLRLGQPSPD